MCAYRCSIIIIIISTKNISDSIVVEKETCERRVEDSVKNPVKKGCFKNNV